MPINHQDQLNLLKDILSNHQTDCCGSVSECEQLERLVKSLMVHPNMDQRTKPVLEEIYYYGQNGRNSSQLDNHIELHQQELSQWVNDINQFS
ncbi:YtzH-like family protein [Bacillus sp. FJAT-29790]|uniref:YtzH-like family protein n=1 Tax=Bacillus sp. FJAT-29790 TaxID=1895002 RepID=UPI001C2477AE|nr:YtzH-like family protein [Bacillus sp. FJAT-29790]MBU8879783.1 YtzH-like family protein [Bacillus sp. FJAT-29790]